MSQTTTLFDGITGDTATGISSTSRSLSASFSTGADSVVLADVQIDLMADDPIHARIRKLSPPDPHTCGGPDGGHQIPSDPLALAFHSAAPDGTFGKSRPQDHLSGELPPLECLIAPYRCCLSPSRHAAAST
jgi:hypothetical protein